MGDFKTMKDCVQWLGSIHRGTAEEMEALVLD